MCIRVDTPREIVSNLARKHSPYSRACRKTPSLMRHRVIPFLCLALLVPALTAAAPPPGIPDGWSDGYVYANGARLHYYRAVPAPGKPVIVMVHGVTDIGLSW